jgi:teichuronic acid biosynthesis glycosyltransferase TuaC
MRILFFSTAFPQPHEPSRNPDNLERCRALARHHDVHVMSPLSLRHAGWTRTEREPFEGPRLSLSRPRYGYPPGLLRGTHAWCMRQSIRRRASRAVAQFRPTAVLSYWTYPDSAVAADIAREANVPCVAIVGGSDVLSLNPASPDARTGRVTSVLGRVDAIAAVSDSLKEHIIALGIPGNKVHVLPPAVDTAIFCPGAQDSARRRIGAPPESSVIVWVGRMVAVKALDVLLDAVSELAPQWPELRLYLIGDGPLRRSLETSVSARSLSQHVVFTGRLAHRDLPDYYRAADVTVLPSHWEGMPNTVLESQACGTPFVASAVGAIPQLANRGIDETVAPGDARQLARALASSLRRPRLPVVPLSPKGGWEESAAYLSDLLDAARRTRSVSTPRFDVKV